MTLHTGPSKTNSHRPPKVDAWKMIYIFPFGALGSFSKGVGVVVGFRVYILHLSHKLHHGVRQRIFQAYSTNSSICGVQFGGELPLAVLFETHMMQIQPRKTLRLKPKKSFYKNLQASRHLQGGLPIKEN